MNRIHPTALCDGAVLGPGVMIDAMAVLAADAEVGDDCAIGSHATLGAEVRLGDRVVIGAGARLGAGAQVHSDAQVGENAVVAPGVVLGRDSVVEPGSVVGAPVPAKAVVRGSPATITGYVHSLPRPAVLSSADPGSEPVDVGAGCSLWPLPNFRDLRGSLVAIEYDRDLPFAPARSFLVYGVPSEEVRGEHAHRWCSQVLVAAHGGLSVVVDDAKGSTEIRLDRPNQGLLVPAGVWGVQYRFSSEAVLCVLASHAYDPDDYIRDYEEFLRFASSSQPSTTSSG